MRPHAFVITGGNKVLTMKRNHQNRDVVQQLSTHFRYALLVLVLAAPSAYAAPSPAPDRFAQADSNHDGKLSRDEASDYLVIEIFTSRYENHDDLINYLAWPGGNP